MASASVPAQYPGQPTSEVRWSTSLFHCFSDMHSCCLTFWCPCVAFGRISEIADKGSSSPNIDVTETLRLLALKWPALRCLPSTLVNRQVKLLDILVSMRCFRADLRNCRQRILLLTGFGCLYSCTYRAKLRKLYMLEESPCGDCCVHCFCELCALCQEYRELQNQGFDVSAGWDGNSQKNNQGVAMAPVVEGGMKR
ncbi:protein PLANT CADMIUM RESISTANCE 2-like [Carya illinoinensis]|uniref:protein PLANT CADMIUM RESISTANCE 2-like n=1 Tax=Carya illinoinensis TaxID=32201 RepID=UPI001C71ABD6|nr:protein PLANT CADMIUM RESISTANCE 2-like [Carya illinoinensis]